MGQRLISLDPGSTTGFAIFEQDPDEQWVIGDVGEIADFPASWLINNIKHPDLVIYEQIHVFSRHIETEGLEVIGAIRLACWLNDITPEPREPSYLQGARKWPLVFDTKISSVHGKDAVLHAVVKLHPDNVKGVTLQR